MILGCINCISFLLIIKLLVGVNQSDGWSTTTHSCFLKKIKNILLCDNIIPFFKWATSPPRKYIKEPRSLISNAFDMEVLERFISNQTHHLLQELYLHPHILLIYRSCECLKNIVRSPCPCVYPWLLVNWVNFSNQAPGACSHRNTFSAYTLLSQTSPNPGGASIHSSSKSPLRKEFFASNYVGTS